MPSQNQSIVNNIPAPGDSAGGGRNTTPRNEKILKQSFPNSPLHDDGFDESARDFYERNVLNGVRPAGLGINNFNADYLDSPDIEEIALNSTGYNGDPAKGKTIDDRLWTIPNPASPDGNSGLQLPFEEVIRQPSINYGSGKNNGTLNPKDTSESISSQGLQPLLLGVSGPNLSD